MCKNLANITKYYKKLLIISKILKEYFFSWLLSLQDTVLNPGIIVFSCFSSFMLYLLGIIEETITNKYREIVKKVFIIFLFNKIFFKMYHH